MATTIADELVRSDSGRTVRIDEGVTVDLLQRVARHDLAAAVVMESTKPVQQHGVRIDTLRDEPLLAALPESYADAGAEAIPLGAFVAEVVMLPKEPPGQMFNVWFRTVIRVVGFDLDRTMKTLSAPWDRRMLPLRMATRSPCSSTNGRLGRLVSLRWRSTHRSASRWISHRAGRRPRRCSSWWRRGCVLAMRVGWLTERRARSERPTD